MAIKYQATPFKGRVGKHRQVKPFEFEVDSRPGNLDKLAHQLCQTVSKIATRRDLIATIDLPPNTSTIKAEVFDRGDNLVGQFYIDQIEE